MLLYQDYCWPVKNTNEFNYAMKFVVRPSSKFQFAFGFNESVRIFFLIKFWKIIVLYLGCGCMTFDFTTQITSSYLLPHADE